MPHARDIVHDIFGAPLGVSALNASSQSHFALADVHLNVRCVYAPVVCQTLTDIFADPLIRACKALGATSVVASLPHLVHTATAFSLIIPHP